MMVSGSSLEDLKMIVKGQQNQTSMYNKVSINEDKDSGSGVVWLVLLKGQMINIGKGTVHLQLCKMYGYNQ